MVYIANDKKILTIYFYGIKTYSYYNNYIIYVFKLYRLTV